MRQQAALERQGRGALQIDPARVAEAFEPAAERTGLSPREYDMQIADLIARKEKAINLLMENEGSVLAPDLRRRAESLKRQIEDKRKERHAAAKADRERPHLPTTQAAIGAVAALGAKTNGGSGLEKRM